MARRLRAGRHRCVVFDLDAGAEAGDFNRGARRSTRAAPCGVGDGPARAALEPEDSVAVHAGSPDAMLQPRLDPRRGISW
ncbi:MAG: hypothetical protein M3461_04730 [Pseudomonadota bacterium]|nr:hypothetical protein [Pseudomonadota bacterium]